MAGSLPPFNLTEAKVARLGFLKKENQYNYQNWLGVVKRRIAAGQSAVIQFWGDSTTRNSIPADGTPNRYPGQWAADLAASGRVPANYGIRVYAFDNVSTNKYQLAQTIRDPGNNLWLDIYQASVSGSVTRYFMHGHFFKALAAISADALYIGHGFNMASWTNIRGEIAAAIEQYRLQNPSVPILWSTQHPMQSATTMDTNVRPIVIASADDLGYKYNDYVFQQYLIQGKPDSLYNGDGLHESTGPGCALYIKALNDEWDASFVAFVPQRMSALHFLSDQQMLVNGDFQSWTTQTAAPDGWTSAGTITFSKDTANYANPRKAFSCKMIASGTAQTHISQIVGAKFYPYLLGQYVTACARIQKDVGGTSSFLGRLAIIVTAPSLGGTAIMVVTDANIVQSSGAFGWLVTKPILIPSDATGVTVRFFVDTSAAPDATKAVYVDQISLVPGKNPRPYSF